MKLFLWKGDIKNTIQNTLLQIPTT